MDNPVKLEILPPLKRNWRRSLGYTWPCPAAIRPQRNRRDLRRHGTAPAVSAIRAAAADAQLSAGGYRSILAHNYLIVYRLLGNTIVIYHIAHGATDYPKLLKTTFFQ